MGWEDGSRKEILGTMLINDPVLSVLRYGIKDVTFTPLSLAPGLLYGLARHWHGLFVWMWRGGVHNVAVVPVPVDDVENDVCV